MDTHAVLRVAKRYVPAAAGMAALGVVLLPLRGHLPLEAVMLLFVPAIVAVSRLTGVRVTAVATVVAFLTINFLFVPPFHTLRVEPLSQWVALFVFLAVGLTTGRQAGRLREREKAALDRQRELELLNRASSRAASERSPDELAAFVVAQVTEVMGAARAALYGAGDGAGRLLADAGRDAPEADETAMVAWVLREGKAIGLPHEAVPLDQRPVSVPAGTVLTGSEARGVYLPLQSAEGLEGALVAVPAHDGRVSDSDARLLAALANLSASCLERQRLEDQASRAEALREADRLKSTLVSSVSHELKTPLAAATARVTGLLEQGEGCDAARVTRELTAVARDLRRLDVSIGDLLDISRLESASWRQRLERFDMREILGTVRADLPPEARERIHFDIADVVPDVLVDGSQFVRALTNVIENALAYSPAGSPVRVLLSMTADGRVEVAVEDRGPGVPDDEKARVFEKFYRGSASPSAPSGSGLGLTIAAEIVRGHGGSMRVEDAKPNGARFVVVIPRAEEAP